MCFKQDGAIFILYDKPLKLIDHFTFLGSSISSTESDVNILIKKIWTTIARLSLRWESDLTDKTKQDFFQAVAVPVLLYGCTALTQTKRMENKLDGKYTRMLRLGSSNSQDNSCTATYLLFHKPSHYDKQDMLHNAGEVKSGVF